MYGDNKNDEILAATWDDFCDHLKSAGNLIFNSKSPAEDIERAKGFRLLSRNIALALQFKLENANPHYPELMHYFDPIRKQGGDNSDAVYHGAPINGTDTYTIKGQLGTAKYIAITVLEDGATPWGGEVVGTLFKNQIVADDYGNFEIILSPEEHAENWIKTSPASWRVTIRQFFGNWEKEEPMNATIDCLTQTEPKKEVIPSEVISGLSESAKWLTESIEYWIKMIDRWQEQPNKFFSYHELEKNQIDATPGGEPLICYWSVPDGKALIIRVYPPEANYWSVEFGSYWWETLDYRYRLCSTNCEHAVLEDSGELVIVVSHEDPQVPNWLDPSGHKEGYVTFRWIGSETYPKPKVTLTELSSLEKELSNGFKTISRSDRDCQIKGRRKGILKRFRL